MEILFFFSMAVQAVYRLQSKVGRYSRYSSRVLGRQTLVQ